MTTPASYRPARSRRAMEVGDFARLTGNELRVVGLVCDGNSARKIGDSMHIEESTVRTYLQRIYRKIGVSGKVSLAMAYLRWQDRRKGLDENQKTA